MESPEFVYFRLDIVVLRHPRSTEPSQLPLCRSLIIVFPEYRSNLMMFEKVLMYLVEVILETSIVLIR